MSERQYYVGRFAPSPSGDLHFGSLVAAMGSYLQARANHGQWLVRIEDIDPPREVPGSANRILKQLEHYGLLWDGPVVYQSQRHDLYLSALHQLKQQGLCYYCICPRQRIQQIGGHYDGYCRTLNRGADNAALRLRQTSPIFSFYDQLRSEIHTDPALASEDFIIHRRDGMFAYNLAVVVDDHQQGITEIVRGADLIEPTVHQLTLYRQFGYTPPSYVHLPLVLNTFGDKLSKQNHAPPLPDGDPRQILIQALAFLCQPLPECWRDLSLTMLLTWAIAHWSLSSVPSKAIIPAPKITSAFSKG
ncbi:tRNA glutamyl-Q(34) synthetase GluQRS [Pectobacteriaceae bacterium C52]|nr:tRNA glutamyl-Q(34) synthetase GluQRS [Pectobacteriaceae bacterium C52]